MIGQAAVDGETERVEISPRKVGAGLLIEEKKEDGDGSRIDSIPDKAE